MIRKCADKAALFSAGVFCSSALGAVALFLDQRGYYKYAGVYLHVAFLIGLFAGAVVFLFCRSVQRRCQEPLPEACDHSEVPEDVKQFQKDYHMRLASVVNRQCIEEPPAMHRSDELRFDSFLVDLDESRYVSSYVH